MKPGDVVRVKSGGPPMTVEEVQDVKKYKVNMSGIHGGELTEVELPAMIKTAWFVSGNLIKEWFKPDMLEAAK